MLVDNILPNDTYVWTNNILLCIINNIFAYKMTDNAPVLRSSLLISKNP